jgi:predicted amidohydrolase YtcJ
MKHGQHNPDMILLNGHLLTMDEKGSTQEALSIRNSHIQAVGRKSDLYPLAGPATEIIDLQGRTVIPGIIDAHAHMDREGLKRILPGFEGAHSIAEVLGVIKREVTEKKAGEWVVTMPIGDPPNYADVPAILDEKRFPTRWELDRVSSDHPVYIKGIWSPWNRPPSVSVANSYALRLAQVDRHTLSPHSSVTIEHDDRGEPTGVITDHNMVPITEFTLMRVVPRFTAEDRVRGLRESMRLYSSVGVTAVYEGHGVAPEVLGAYRTLWETGAITIRSRLVISPSWRSLKEARTEMSRWERCASPLGFGDEMVKLCGYFIQWGGERHVAELRSTELPYTGWAGFTVSCNTPSRFRALIRMATKHNLRVHTIASTQDETEGVLRAFEMVHRETPISGRRWVIEHVREISSTQLQRIRRMGIVCTTIPLTHLWLRGALYVKNDEQARRAVPHRSFLEHGIPFAMGTDNKPYNPFHTLWAAVVRREKHSGMVIGPEQCLSRIQALRAFTMGGAYLCGEEIMLGSLEPEKWADLAVLSENPLKVPEERLPEIHSVLTLVGGRVVHDSGDVRSGSRRTVRKPRTGC